MFAEVFRLHERSDPGCYSPLHIRGHRDARANEAVTAAALACDIEDTAERRKQFLRLFRAEDQAAVKDWLARNPRVEPYPFHGRHMPADRPPSYPWAQGRQSE